MTTKKNQSDETNAYHLAMFRSTMNAAAKEGAGKSSSWHYDRAMEYREDSRQALIGRNFMSMGMANQYEDMAEAHFRIAAKMRHASEDAARKRNPSIKRKALPKRRADGTFAPKRR